MRLSLCRFILFTSRTMQTQLTSSMTIVFFWCSCSISLLFHSTSNLSETIRHAQQWEILSDSFDLGSISFLFVVLCGLLNSIFAWICREAWKKNPSLEREKQDYGENMLWKIHLRWKFNLVGRSPVKTSFQANCVRYLLLNVGWLKTRFCGNFLIWIHWSKGFFYKRDEINTRQSIQFIHLF